MTKIVFVSEGFITKEDVDAFVAAVKKGAKMFRR